jgi:transcriptional regulator with XRE-family HTH domain
MKTPDDKQNRLARMFAKARQTHAYKAQGASLEFTEDMAQLMRDQEVCNSQLAQRIGASPAYVTKILRGGTNFTLDTMVKIASALDAEFRCHLQGRGMRSVWVDYKVEQAHRQSVPVRESVDVCEIVFTPTKLPKQQIAATYENTPAAA